MMIKHPILQAWRFAGVFLLGAALLAPLHAQDEGAQPAEEPAAETAPVGEVVKEEEPVIPAAYDVSHYASTWERRSPFLGQVVPPVPTANDGLARDWALAGMARIGAKEVVYIQNKQTGESKRLTNQDGDNSEFRLVSVSFERNRSKAEVKVSRGAEVATLKYDENLTSKPVTINNTTGQQQRAGAPITPGVPVSPTGARTGTTVKPPAVTGTRPGPSMPTPTQGGLPPMPTAGGIPQPPVGGTTAPVAPSISRRRQLIPPPQPVNQP